MIIKFGKRNLLDLILNNLILLLTNNYSIDKQYFIQYVNAIFE